LDSVEPAGPIGLAVVAACDRRDRLSASKQLIKPRCPKAHVVVVDGIVGTQADIDEVVAARRQHVLNAIQHCECFKILLVAFTIDAPVIDIGVRRR
jgi:hypothetical protein